MTGLAAELGAFAADLRPADVPQAVRDHAALMVTDLLASAAGGYRTELARTARRAGTDLFGAGEVGVWFGTRRLGWLGAAYANSSAATALDIDDGHRGACGHAGAAVVPAALAAAARTGASGTETLAAIILGYDIALRIASARRPERIEGYNSGPWAAYGAAVAAGRLLGLDAGAMAQALAIAGAEAPASLPTGASRRMGSTVKEGIPWAVIAGLGAAVRAGAGGTGPDDLLDRPSIYDPAAMVAGLGHDWSITRTYLKPYACCRYIHAALDAIAALRQPGRPITSLTVRVFPEGLDLMNAPAPDSLEAAQYSYPFCCALAVLRGPEALQPMRAEALRDPEVLALAARVDFDRGAEFSGSFPSHTPARVTLDQGDGPQTRVVLYPLGDVANPMPAAQVREKFLHLTKDLIAPDRQAAILGAIRALAEGPAESLLTALTDGHDATRPSPLQATTGATGN